MAADSLATVVKRRLLGIVFIVVVIGLIGLSIAIYNKAFTDTVEVTLRADHTGNQLIVDSDVKERGIIVGSVTKVRSNGDGAIVTLELSTRAGSRTSRATSRRRSCPRRCSASSTSRWSPSPTARRGAIRAHDTIPQDRSRGALESQRVLGDILPLLTAVDPADLNATLTGAGRSAAQPRRQAGPDAGQLRQLPQGAEPAHQAARRRSQQAGPGVARSTTTSRRTSSRRCRTCRPRPRRSSSSGPASTACSCRAPTPRGSCRASSTDNEQRLIAVTGQTNKIYGLLNEYSPEFSCLFAGINHLYDLAGQAIYDNRIHLSRDRSTPTTWAPTSPARSQARHRVRPELLRAARQLQPTDANGRFQIPDKYQCLNDGAPLTARAPRGCGRHVEHHERRPRARRPRTRWSTRSSPATWARRRTRCPEPRPCSPARCCAGSRWWSNERLSSPR